MKISGFRFRIHHVDDGDGADADEEADANQQKRPSHAQFSLVKVLARSVSAGTGEKLWRRRRQGKGVPGFSQMLTGRLDVNVNGGVTSDDDGQRDGKS